MATFYVGVLPHPFQTGHPPQARLLVHGLQWRNPVVLHGRRVPRLALAAWMTSELEGQSREGRNKKFNSLYVINEGIRSEQVRVFGEGKEPLGVLQIETALEMASNREMDLILTVPTAVPPVCRLMEIGKYHYEKQKEERKRRKMLRAKSSELKSLKFRPSTDVHDYQVKIRAAQRFLERGDQVRILMQFRKREALLLPDAETMCQRIVDDLADKGKAVEPPKLSKWTVQATLVPK